MYVICFYWEGERWQETQNPQGTFADHLSRVGSTSLELVSVYVNNLYYGVKRFANQPFKFICFTNTQIPNLDENIETRYLPLFTKKGVLPRLYMFSHEAGLFGHQVLCLDLDVVIVGSLQKLMDYRGMFCTRASFDTPKKIDGDIMSFRAGEEMEKLIWKSFIEDVNWTESYTRGRERWWLRYVAGDWADMWGSDDNTFGGIASYKKHIVRRGREIPSDVSIVSCHGRPRPHQINDKWRKKYWSYEN